MVYLDKIYTKSGDQGSTCLGDGARVPKTAARIVAYGCVDELNSIIGVIRATDVDSFVANCLESIQHRLFDLGAELCVPKPADSTAPARITEQHVADLEGWIDEANESLEPLTSFILPGGCAAAANLHHGRTVCRRCEIEVLRLADDEAVDAQVVVYLNRLSDLLFVFARRANDNGASDVLWVEGK